MNAGRMLVYGLIWVGATGCSAPREDPMTELHVPGLFTRHTAEIGVISTGASYRVITFRVKPEKGTDQPAGAFCAEPPPDAAEAIASRLAATLEAKAPVQGSGGQSTAVEGAGSFDRAFTTAVFALTRRSQGLQFARDQTTAACQDYLNGRIGKSEYLQLRRDIIASSMPLIRAEINNLPNLNTFSASAPSLQTPVVPRPR